MLAPWVGQPVVWTKISINIGNGLTYFTVFKKYFTVARHQGDSWKITLRKTDILIGTRERMTDHMQLAFLFKRISCNRYWSSATSAIGFAWSDVPTYDVYVNVCMCFILYSKGLAVQECVSGIYCERVILRPLATHLCQVHMHILIVLLYTFK